MARTKPRGADAVLAALDRVVARAAKGKGERKKDEPAAEPPAEGRMDASDGSADPVVIGIDPGFSGGIVAVTMVGHPVAGTAMPATRIKGGNELDMGRIRAFFAAVAEGRTVNLVAVEKVHSMPRDSKAGAFRFGFYFGKICAVVEMLDLPLELVTPQAWQKVVLHGTQQKSKQDAIAFARRRFPGLSLRATAKCKVDHDGIADAACIAEWARRQVLGK